MAKLFILTTWRAGKITDFIFHDILAMQGRSATSRFTGRILVEENAPRLLQIDNVGAAAVFGSCVDDGTPVNGRGVGTSCPSRCGGL